MHPPGCSVCDAAFIALGAIDRHLACSRPRLHWAVVRRLVLRNILPTHLEMRGWVTADLLLPWGVREVAKSEEAHRDYFVDLAHRVGVETDAILTAESDEHDEGEEIDFP